jgi:cell wall-associated NlpC family hydrolase
MSVSPHAGVAVLGISVLLAISAPRATHAGGVYFVKEGDTLAGISRVFGVAPEKLRGANNFKAAEVKPGDRLRIPDGQLAVQPRIEAVRHQDPGADLLLQAICREEKVYHSVARGDTLSSIARRYSVQLADLLRLNDLGRRSKLAVGQKVLVRQSGPRSLTVAGGETLSDISARSGLPVDEIVRLNQLEGERIASGQRLYLEPCDPYAAAGSAPPPLKVPEASASPALPAPAPSATATRRVIELARTMLDIPYRFGGTTLRGIDCSAYVQRVFGLLDIKIPRTAREQYSVGSTIGRDDLAGGDLVFFRTYASFPSHVGIYIGDNLFIHASSMVRKVTIDRIDLPYYRKRFLGARRLFLDESPALAAAP